MILEGAMLQVKKNMEREYEASLKDASSIISKMDGYINHSLNKCFEEEGKYLLLVKWETLESHTIGFRKSEEYQKWKSLLHCYYEPFPVVEHFQEIKF